MTIFLVIVIPFLVILAVLTMVDVFRRVDGGWKIAAWAAFIVFVPVIGAAAYWLTRKAEPELAEQAYLANADVHRERGRRY